MDENKEFDMQNSQEQPSAEEPSENSDAQGVTESGNAEEPASPEAQTLAQPEESSSETAITPPTYPEPVPEGGPAPAKAGKGFLVWIGIAAVLIVVIVAVLMSGVLFKKPEQAVHEAFSATGERLQALSDQLITEIPLYDMLYHPSEGSREGEFKLVFDNFTGGPGGLEQELLVNFLKTLSISGKYATEQENNMMELNAGFNMASVPLIDVYAQFAPEQIAFHIPSFSDTVLSLNPQTIAQDIQNSPLYDPSTMTPEQLTEMQELFNTQLNSMGAMNKIDYEQLQNDMYAMLWEFLTNATYEKPEKSADGKIYTVHLDGEQVKATLYELVNYIYIDSDIGDMYPQELKDQLREQIINPLQDLPPLPADLIVTINSEGLLSKVEMDVAPIESDLLSVQAIHGVYELDANMNAAIVLDMKVSDESGPCSMKLDMKADYTDGNVVADGTIAMDLYGEKLNMDIGMDLGKDGKTAIDLTAYGDGIELGVVLKGSVTAGENGEHTWDFPTVQFRMAAPEEYIVNLKASAKSKAAGVPMTLRTDTVPLLSMTEGQLAEESLKYNEGMYNLITQIFGALFPEEAFGNSEPFSAAPEAAPAA